MSVSLWCNTATRDATPDGTSPVDTPPVYVADVIEKEGSRIARRVHWDIGRWSELWQKWRPVPEITSFQVRA